MADNENLRTSSVSDAVDRIQTNGLAIWPGIIPRQTAEDFAENVIKSDQRTHRDTRTSKYLTSMGPLEKVLPIVLRSAVRQVFDAQLGPNWVVSLSESVAFQADQNSRGHGWHQDAAVNNYPTALVWIALTDIGFNSPGIEFISENPKRAIEIFLDEPNNPEEKAEYITRNFGEEKVVHPVLQPGDAIFFNHHSIHRTARTIDKPSTRVSFKVTGVASDFAEQVALPITFEQT